MQGDAEGNAFALSKSTLSLIMSFLTIKAVVSKIVKRDGALLIKTQIANNVTVFVCLLACLLACAAACFLLIV